MVVQEVFLTNICTISFEVLHEFYTENVDISKDDFKFKNKKKCLIGFVLQAKNVKDDDIEQCERHGELRTDINIISSIYTRQEFHFGPTRFTHR